MLAGVSVAIERSRDGSYAHNATTSESFVLSPNRAIVGFDAETGTVGMMGLLRMDVSKAMTILDIRPWQMDAGVEVLAVRAIFYGRGTSPGGYNMFSGYPLVGCLPDRPFAGFGPSYPTVNLTVAPGDPIQFVFYVRAKDPGHYWVRGYRIRYRTADGSVRSITGDEIALEMYLRRPGEPPTDDHEFTPCRPDVPLSWDDAVPGFPG